MAASTTVITWPGQASLSGSSSSDLSLSPTSTTTTLEGSFSAVVPSTPTSTSTLRTIFTSTSSAIPLVSTTANITTIFTPATTCLGPTLTFSPAGLDTTSVLSASQGNVTAAIRALSLQCYPSAFATVIGYPSVTVFNGGSTPTSVLVYQSYYSPAQCPVNYTSVAQHIVGPTNSATCCPPGPSLTYQNGACWDLVNTTATIFTGTTSFEKLLNGGILAAPITVAWQSSDLSLWVSPTTAAAPPSSTSVATGAPSISDAAAAGIGVGVTVGVLFVGAATAIWWLRRMRRRQDPRSDHEPDSSTAAEVAGDHLRSVEKDGNMVSEMEVPYLRAELAGDVAEHELADCRGNWISRNELKA